MCNPNVGGAAGILAQQLAQRPTTPGNPGIAPQPTGPVMPTRAPTMDYRALAGLAPRPPR